MRTVPLAGPQPAVTAATLMPQSKTAADSPDSFWPESQLQQTSKPSNPATPNHAQELGISVLGDLQRQRETILHSRDALAGVDEGISRSRAILSSMSRRIMQNKIIMWGIVALLLGAIGLIVWAKLS
uniref:Uncharacterized protein n=1 Tax=Auxenochlorella protothecoides TaxID=3075 RepID=A0A1D1ZXH9_AUXPR